MERRTQDKINEHWQMSYLNVYLYTRGKHHTASTCESAMIESTDFSATQGTRVADLSLDMRIQQCQHATYCSICWVSRSAISKDQLMLSSDTLATSLLHRTTSQGRPSALTGEHSNLKLSKVRPAFRLQSKHMLHTIFTAREACLGAGLKWLCQLHESMHAILIMLQLHY